jgi:hypothetical protein
MDDLILNQAPVTDFGPQCVEKQHPIDRIERPVLPLTGLVKDRVGYPADQAGRDLGPVKLGKL